MEQHLNVNYDSETLVCFPAFLVGRISIPMTQDRLESFDKSFAEVRGSLNFASRERKHLEEREDEFEAKLMRMQEFTDERQDAMPKIVEEMEKNSIFAKTLEKRLENLHKEKTLQDKLLKDMHESLQQKVEQKDQQGVCLPIRRSTVHTIRSFRIERILMINPRSPRQS